MSEDTPSRLARLNEFQNKLEAAVVALAAVIEDSELTEYQPQRSALLDALRWLEIDTTCGDCIEGRCHWGGAASKASIALAEKGVEYVDPDSGRCGCGRHETSVQARQRHARLTAAGLLS